MPSDRIPKNTTRFGAARRKRIRFKWAGQGPVTVIDLDGGTIRVAQSWRRGGKPAILQFASTKFDPALSATGAEPQELGKAISAALRDLNIKPASIVMALPRGLVFLRTLTLPAAGSIAELASIIQFQISKDLPFRLEEAVVDFTILRFLTPTAPNVGQASSLPVPAVACRQIETIASDLPAPPENSPASAPANAASPVDLSPASAQPPPLTAQTAAAPDQVEVLVAGVKKEIVERHLHIAEAAGLKLTALGLRPCANARCIGVRSAADQPHAVGLISFRSDEVTIEFVVDQSVVFSRVASVTLPSHEPGRDTSGFHSVPDLTRPSKDFIPSILTEIVRSLHSYESTVRHCPVAKFLVVGGTSAEPALVSALQQRFPMPCERFVPSSAFNVEGVDKESGAGALAALGLALGAQDAEGLPFDFLHPKRPLVPRNWGRIKVLAAVGVGALLLFGLAGLRSYQMGRRLQIKEQVQAQVTQAEKNRPLFRDMRAKAKVVRDWTAEKRHWLDHYALLSALLPPSQDVYLTSLSTGARGMIHLSVQARNGEILAQMDKRLREAGYEVKPLAVTPATDKFGYPFRSSVELTLTSKMKYDLKPAGTASRPADEDSVEPPAPDIAPPAKPAEASPEAKPHLPLSRPADTLSPSGVRGAGRRQGTQ